MPPGPYTVLRLDSVPSTQDVLAQRARRGEDVTGLCVRAREQTSGRGRRGTAWASPRGGSYQSVGLGEEARPWLTLALGVGVAEALARGVGARVLVKWPNDLYLGDGKLGGIIAEVVAGQVIAGVGVNVANPPPPGGASLVGADPEAVSDLVLAGLERGSALARAGGEAVRDAYAAVDALRGREVTVTPADERGGGPLTGVAMGVDALGALLIAVQGAAEPVRVTAGHVTSLGGRER